MIKWLPIGLLVANVSWADLPKTGSNSTVTVEKECHGHSLEDAKTTCFESAIEQVVGQVIVSDRLAKNNELVIYDVAQYSAGYINDFRILDQKQDDMGWVYLRMSIDVASSKIAQRMSTSGLDGDPIIGERLQARLDSERKRRQDGDRLLTQILNSYPYNAFVINITGTNVGHGPYRNPRLFVGYELSLSPKWLEAFSEGLSAVAVSQNECSSLTKTVARAVKVRNNNTGMINMLDSSCGHDPDITIIQDGWVAREKSYSFPDLNTMTMINKIIGTELGKNVVGVRVDVEGRDGTLLDSKCANIPVENIIRFDSNRMRAVNLNQKLMHLRPVLSSKNKLHGTVVVDLDQNYPLQNASNIELTVQTECN